MGLGVYEVLQGRGLILTDRVGHLLDVDWEALENVAVKGWGSALRPPLTLLPAVGLDQLCGGEDG